MLLLDRLDFGYPHHELLQRPRVMGLHNVLHFMRMELRQSRGLHDCFGLITGKDAVKVERDA